MPVESNLCENDKYLYELQHVGMRAQHLQMELMERLAENADFPGNLNAPASDAQLVHAAVQMAEQVQIPLPNGHLPVSVVCLANRELIYLLGSIVDRVLELSARCSRQPDNGYVGLPLKS